MLTTQTDFKNTVNVEEIRSEVLRNMLAYMRSQIKKINEEIVLVEGELKRREGI